MVDDIVDLFGLKFVLDGDGYGAIAERGKKHYAPVGTVASAERHLVATFQTYALKHDVDFLYFASHIVILERDALVI